MAPEDADYFAAARAVPLGPAVPVQGWAPPPAYPPPPTWTPPADEGESGIGVGEGLLVTGIALAASLVLTLGMRGQHVDKYDTALRKGLAYTLFFYLFVGALLGVYVVVRRVRLVWHRDSALAAVSLGIPVGVGGGMLAVAVNSALRGHLSGDPNIELLVGGGGALRILLALVVTTVLAPLVEETVFRGICGGSLLAKGAAASLWLSALAFAIWHMQPASLRYYALMGLLLGRLWQRRGLLASMSTHACFNGVLTVAAIAATTGAASFTTYGQLRFALPGGWHTHTTGPTLRTYGGPAGASLAINRADVPRTLSTDEVVTNLRRATGTAGFEVVAGSEHRVTISGTDAVEADVVVAAQPGHLLVLPAPGVVYTVVVVTGGSPNGERDWRHLESSLRLAPQG